MTTPPTLPPQLWRIRDDAVKCALTNAPLSDDFDRITEWLEGDGWDALMESQGGEFVVSLALLADDLTIDRDLYSEDWFDPDTAVTDVARGRYLRVRIDRCVEAADAGDVSTAYAYTLEREDGMSAVVGCLIDFQGQGSEVCWLGVFPNWEAYIRDLRSRGLWLVDELAEITDDALLEAWRSDCAGLRL